MKTCNQLPITSMRLARLAISAAILALAFPLAHATEKDQLESIRIPIRVLRLNSGSDARLNCTLSDDEIRDQFAIVNRTWEQANIIWEIESIVDIDAKAPDAFTTAKKNPRGQLARALVSNTSKSERLNDGFNVYIAEDFGKSMGGVFVPQEDGIVFYAKRGPKGAQTPAVLTHELGHALGLPHTIFEKDNNLMMGSGPGRIPTPTKPITVSQIEISRSIAKTGKPFSPKQTRRPAREPQLLWRILDTNEDDVMTIDEIRPRHRDFAVDFLRKASRASTDSLTREEFEQINQQQRRDGGSGGGRTWGPEIIPQMFSRFNANNDGYITREEASRPGSLVNANFETWDQATDKDGRLSREEVRERLTAEPASLGPTR